MSRSKHRYLSASPTARSPLFTEDGDPNKVGFPHFIRKSGHLRLCPRCQARSPTNEVREWTIPHPPLSPTTLQNWVGHEAPEINHAAVPKVLPHSASCDQALPTPRSLTVARNQAATPNSPMRRRKTPMKMSTPRLVRVKWRFEQWQGGI